MFGYEGRRQHVEESGSAFGGNGFGQHALSFRFREDPLSGSSSTVDECLGKSRAWEEARLLRKVTLGRGRTTVSWRSPLVSFNPTMSFQPIVPTDAGICDEHFVLDTVDHARIIAIPGKSQNGSFNRLVVVIVDSQMLDNQTDTANSLV